MRPLPTITGPARQPVAQTLRAGRYAKAQIGAREIARLHDGARPGLVLAGEASGNREYPLLQSKVLLVKRGLAIQPMTRSFTVFVLDPRLLQDTLPIGDFPLCRLLLSNDSNYPWFILVPRRPNISEVFELEPADQLRLWQETTQLSEKLKEVFSADKLNVAALGNVVSQLHMHVIVRKRDDMAWPAPVWGKHPAVPYTEAQLAVIREKLTSVLTNDFRFEG